jgi:hypothetical protein
MLKLRAAFAKSRRSSATSPNDHLQPDKSVSPHETTYNHHYGIRVESCRSHVRPWSFYESRNSQLTSLDSYNRYIAVASRVVRRSLKEDKRVLAERRGESELRFAKWEVSAQQG